ncbi:hypothetical protein BXZ70DRAFT_1008432 [Cristinia sonorae]|uniref:Uncharacterized protein n=1 Tax=Cristinia sonorae TaxID=1940300 RepID=A0A8K0UP73_9AGAR|nr:hypothetical protein BXZ70DRAFT_1008432 [Cristinia sonorae]
MHSPIVTRKVRLVRCYDTVQAVLALNTDNFPYPPRYSSSSGPEIPHLASLSQPIYLGDRFFYFALAHPDAFLHDNGQFAHLFRFRFDDLPILSVVEHRRRHYQLDKTLRNKWVEFEDLLLATVAQLEPLWLKGLSRGDISTIQPKWYGYRDNFPDERSARLAASNSRKAVMLLMGYVSFLVLWMERHVPGWKSEISSPLGPQWVDWLYPLPR